MSNTAIGTELVLERPELERRVGAIHKSTLSKWISHGLRGHDGELVRLRAVKRGRHWLTTRDDADRFCDVVLTVIGEPD